MVGAFRPSRKGFPTLLGVTTPTGVACQVRVAVRDASKTAKNRISPKLFRGRDPNGHRGRIVELNSNGIKKWRLTCAPAAAGGGADCGLQQPLVVVVVVVVVVAAAVVAGGRGGVAAVAVAAGEGDDGGGGVVAAAVVVDVVVASGRFDVVAEVAVEV